MADRPEGRKAGASGATRPEIQALRALAVAIVVVFHYWPGLISGGYVGVDVFFVISGFLITGHLVRDLEQRGRVSLPGFWARRARRILPAALLVLAFCTVATLAIVPMNLWDQFFHEIQASTLYVENWYLAHQAVDYLGAENRFSPVQHYWSLSVEEQFYIVWPLLILAVTVAVRGGSPVARRRALMVLMLALSAASLAFSIAETAASPASAFFITPTRIWEFSVGGILSMAAANRVRVGVRAGVSWAGLVMILAAAFLYTPNTPFPGAAALLPVAGALAVIWAESPSLRWSPLSWMRRRSVQWLGDLSYSVYLWHWPLLVLAPFLLLTELTTPIKLLLLALTLVLAATTKRWVEDPLRSGPLLAGHRPRRSFVVGLASTILVLLCCGVALQLLHARQADGAQLARSLQQAGTKCFGAAARDPQHQPCINPDLRLSVVPAPEGANDSEMLAYRREAGCSGGLQHQSTLSICHLGVAPNGAKRQVALIGDSHSMRWRPGFGRLGRILGWSVSSIVRFACPLRGGPVNAQWASELNAWLRANPQVDTLFLSESAECSRHAVAPATRAARIAKYQALLTSYPASVKHIVVLRDNPRTRVDMLDCVERARGDGVPAGPACAAPRAEVLAPDLLALAAGSLQLPTVGAVDLSTYFCSAVSCFPVVGGVLVNSDTHHVTALYSRTLAPFLGRALDAGRWLER